MGNLTESEKARFETRIRKESSDCHVWTGPLDKDGYGSFFLRRRNRRAHRVAWYDMHGPVPDGLVINHVCRNRACVNPQRLQAVTVRENTLKDSSTVSAINARKTHCKNGHPFDRVYRKSNGGQQRYCSICEAAKKRRLQAKWRAEDTLNV
ncbi:HNH endonuclease signature motif containing protein [Streptomyces spinosisporus]|uniref:HNH endonuclease n=1 Tax=Streptomyces spinosisporus TaxID=2927582 RepID=A0ABS9XW15_9ACTN|nr:HNH endonuclease signature motif containing protein [Streptomyces spinosisporus]MCI3246278.1 HNH endonuclease [Streptomyces spinosisporus]